MAFSPSDLKAGDVVIRSKQGVSSIYSYGTVLDDGQMPSHWEIGSKADAEAWAKNWITTTGGTLHQTETGSEDSQP